MSAAPPPAAAPARLYRSRTDRVIAGVAGGLGRHLGVDPVILRIAFVVLVFSGAGPLLYLIAWLIMPLAPEGTEADAAPTRPAASSEALRLLLGGVLVAVGAMILLDRLIPWFDRVALPALLIAVGAAVLVYGARR